MWLDLYSVNGGMMNSFSLLKMCLNLQLHMQSVQEFSALLSGSVIQAILAGFLVSLFQLLSLRCLRALLW